MVINSLGSIHTRTSMHTCMHAPTCSCSPSRSRSRSPSCSHTHTPTQACTHTCMHPHTHSHTHIHKNDAALRCLPRISFTYYSAYDKDWKLSRHSLSLTNSMTSLLILYSKFVWQIWFGQRCLIWLKNIWWLAIIISPTIITSISLPLNIQFLYLWILYICYRLWSVYTNSYPVMMVSSAMPNHGY